MQRLFVAIYGTERYSQTQDAGKLFKFRRSVPSARSGLDIQQRGITVLDHLKGAFERRRQFRRVFDRFFRVPAESVKARKGTGLGLFVVAALVRELGGRIEARSEGLGKGSEFQVSLPAAT